MIPASWYYEWGIPPSEVGYHNANEQRNIKKEKYAIQPEGAEITYLAGLYRFEEHRGIQIPMFACRLSSAKTACVIGYVLTVIQAG